MEKNRNESEREGCLLNVQMLGGFSIRSGESYLEENSKRAPKLWKALQYLIAFRHKSITPDELVDAIWPEEEQSDPKNAMHNMIFRIRSVLIASGIPCGKNLLVYSGGGYSWNNELVCVVDAEEFEKLYTRATGAGAEIEDRTRLQLLLQAIDLYKGDFLPSAGYEMWAVPLTNYYKAIYLKCVHLALEILLQEGEGLQAEMIGEKALLIDPFDEKIHEYRLQALMKQSKYAAALEEYKKLAVFLYDELGVDPPQSLRAVYHDIQQQITGNERPLEELIQEWMGVGSAGLPGAYYCEYDVFKTIYTVEARAVMRSGKSIFIVSLTLKAPDNLIEAAQQNKTDPIIILRDIIQNSLRKGDIFTRTGPYQFVLMLQSLTYEDCNMLVNRIKLKFSKTRSPYILQATAKPITPIT